MDIKLCSNKLKEFNDIETGSTFMYLGEVYMKTNNQHDVNAVNLKTGCLTYFTPTAPVAKIIGSFVEEGRAAEDGY